jgi:ketosteroid isomerase-like protein
MIKPWLLAGILTLGGAQLIPAAATGRSDPATVIRALEEQERQAVLAGNLVSIEVFWDEDFLVNAPHNALLVGRDATADLVRARVIDFSRFDRSVERIEVDGDVAVSMGSETVQQKAGPQAGKIIQRRYTNIWRLKNGKWRLRFRHANVVPGEPQVLDPTRR